MGPPMLHSASSAAWLLAGRQHGVLARGQLLELGFTTEAIRHRLASGRLHPTPWAGVYAVGRPQLIRRHGRWMAAVLACGPGAMLSHDSAAAAWGLLEESARAVHVSIPAAAVRRRPGIVVHRRTRLKREERCGIPLTTPADTLIDLAATHGPARLERAINEADRLDLVDPDALRRAVSASRPRPGVGVLGRVLDRRTFALTDSELERRFLPLARGAGLPEPMTRCRVNGWRVDFFWPELALVVETDGLRYHRTPAEQARDRLRDQTHAAAGLTPLRFTHAQVRFEPRHVRSTLAAVAGRQRPTGRSEAG